MAENKLSKFRSNLLEWVGQALIGPGFNLKMNGPDPKEHVLTGINPLDRYHTGILFPVVPGESGLDPACEEPDEYQDPTDDDSDIQNEPNSRKQRYTAPSSVGFSFFVKGNVRLQVIPEGVKYVLTKLGQKDLWTRTLLGDFSHEAFFVESPKSRLTTEYRKPVFADEYRKEICEIHVLWRPLSDGWMTTVSFSNKQMLGDCASPRQFADDRCSLSIFEAGLKCLVDKGDVGVYPRVDPDLLTEEEMELELQYRDRRTYAVGHGAAVGWSIGKNGRIKEIRSCFLPAVEVPQVTADVDKGGSDVLDIAVLSRYTFGDQNLQSLLVRFVSDYENWVREQKNNAEPLTGHEKKAAIRITRRMETAILRMRLGLEVLEKNSLAAKAFSIANQAMQDQMATYDLILGKSPRKYRWRPFQLAFFLVSLESVVNEDSEFRDLVDLIWFPTGGGKTEAYLALIAFLITYRRLAFPSSSGGTSVLMRYTLRLLTAQQFERACRLICALEIIRRQSSGLLGNEPISAGMWVGQASSPNSFKEAMDAIRGSIMGSGETPRSLILSSCPRCGSMFNVKNNFISDERSFRFRCVNPDCYFGKYGGGLPCQVVDEALYENPSTLVISTVDKFARLAWDERATAFFGLKGNRPPEMIIQDELHLIAGDLGSVAGLYEAALDTVLIQKGVRPKYIASTATIKMADQQVRRLYARDLAVFPPPGLSCDDSFFARTVPLDERPGRLYVGYLAPLKRKQECMAPLAGAILSAPEIIFGDQADKDMLFDSWWTMIVYHGSLKGVGISQNAFREDVPRYYKLFKRNVHDTDDNDADDSLDDAMNRNSPELATLTSVSTPEQNRKTFDRLERRYDEAGYLDALLATNMVSVGLDVARLSLMIINGQPLTTAEYIQASSRVGRSEVPGLVFANYYRSQARSLSHYEDFRSYHESFYRFVEPTSITPYTYQARMRALHAAIVIVIRHGCKSFLTNGSAVDFDPSDPEAASVLQRLNHRCALADPERSLEVKDHINRLVAAWKHEAGRCKADKRAMDYSVSESDRSKERLLYNHHDRTKGLWPTLQSMRNIGDNALMVLL